MTSQKTSSFVPKKDEELAAIDFELSEIEAQLLSLQERKDCLLSRKEQLKDQLLLEKSNKLAQRDWSGDFPWSQKVKDAATNVFKLPSFRPLQLQTMNAVLSKQDVILIMPTGGGKSLCYQLPAIVSKGVAIVVSPLVSLMEDQLMALKELHINAAMMSATITKEENNKIMQAMTDDKSPLNLLYVTPERLAKSKRFMAKLQKMYQIGRLSMIAIDEVHCCSQWGHDFRPDYKFLGVLKPMFPEVPLLGLTATATSRITVDVQKMLNIQGCLVFKASFNRPNLYYEVRTKPSNQKECIDELAELLKTRFSGKSGIIYTTSIKDCEELMTELRKRNLRIGCYHANLEATLRSKVHHKWMTGEYQAVVATIAFGLGIDKPDVRFVIHHCLSKSMENFYQESGRAGRDNKPAECILFYRFADVFKLSTMVFTQQTGLQNLYGILRYCLDGTKCRRSIIASYFDESWEKTDCNKMCDHCRKPRDSKEIDIAPFCRDLYKIIGNAAGADTRLTSQMLLDAWYGKGKANTYSNNVPTAKLSREIGESVVAQLLVYDYLKEDFHFTPYSTISYLKRGSKAGLVTSPNFTIKMVLPGKPTANIQPNILENSKNKKTENDSVFESNLPLPGNSSSNSIKLKHCEEKAKKISAVGKSDATRLEKSEHIQKHNRLSTKSSTASSRVISENGNQINSIRQTIDLCSDSDGSDICMNEEKCPKSNSRKRYIISSDSEEEFVRKKVSC